MSGPFTFTDALIFAAEVHKGQKDKGGVDYIKHPLYLAHKIARKGGSNEAQMAAIMHDCVEDGKADHEEVYQLLSDQGCPESVIDALRLLTHVPSKEYIDRRAETFLSTGLANSEPDPKGYSRELAKEEEYLLYVAQASHNDIARMVKIEDLRHNSDIRRMKPSDMDGKSAKRIVKYSKALEILTGGKVGYV